MLVNSVVPHYLETLPLGYRKSSSTKLSVLSRKKYSPLTSRCSSGQEPNESRTNFPLEKMAKLLWGKGLPPGILVTIAKEGWTAAWKVMMSQLAPSSASGAYVRPSSAFHHRISPGSNFPPEKGRYHLYAALACPWAHRTLIVHSLKGLSDSVPISIATPGETGLWQFDSSLTPSSNEGLYHPSEDRANGSRLLRDVYKMRSGGYDGRSTVPMLWDSLTKEVVNNESGDIIQILNSDFNDFALKPELDLEPVSLKSQIDTWNEEIYHKVNNGVYRCGFATTQEAYNKAAEDLFSTLDKIDRQLSTSRYLCGPHLTMADIRLFTTLFRFDSVYHIIFKCSKRKISEYSNLSGYVKDIFQIPGVAETCNLESVVESYYGRLFPLNPGGIVPLSSFSDTNLELKSHHGRSHLNSNE